MSPPPELPIDTQVQTAASALRSQLELRAQDLHNVIQQGWQRQKDDVQLRTRVATLGGRENRSIVSTLKSSLSRLNTPFQRKFVPVTQPRRIQDPAKTSTYLLFAFFRIICGVSMAECSIVLP